MSAPASSSSTSPVHTGPITVLLVEDDEGDALIVREELADAALPVQITWARSIAEAEEHLPGDVACVLLDLGLPDASGLEGLRRLRDRAPDVAVLVLTGHDDEHRGIEALGTGAQDYLVKGAAAGPLLARSIRYAIERRRAERSQLALREANLQARENARLERGLLPTPIVANGLVQVTTGYRAGRRRALLGGDFYDVVQAADGAVHAVIGDVSGHSADEAALGVSLRIAWRTLVLAGRPPAEVLPTLEELLMHERHSAEIFTTLCALRIAPGGDRAELHLAGHPPPILFGAGGAGLVEGRICPPLGVMQPGSWPGTEVSLPPRWALLLYTDGLIEGRVDGQSGRLGSERLAAMVGERTGDDDWRGDPRTLVDGLIGAVEALNGGDLTDDLAMLVIADGR
jgi:serine phosphatase RsbU (regulator of sigma subunit)